LKSKESDKEIFERIAKIQKNPKSLSDEDVSLLKEAFGKDFLTDKYFIKTFKTVN